MQTSKVIVTVAPTGGLRTKKDNPHLPTQPEEIAEDVYRCFNAGASMAALHARRRDDEATCDSSIYMRINQLVRSRCDVVINNSTGGGINGDMIRRLPNGLSEVAWEERVKALDGGAEMCTLNALTVVACLDNMEVLFSTPPSRCRQMAQLMIERGIKPEWEAFSPEHIAQDMSALIAAGIDKPPYFVNLAIGFDQVFQGAMPYSPKNLQSMVDQLPANCVMSVSAAGAAQLPAALQMLLLGGHVRVGLEDSLHYRPGELASNIQLVDRIVRLIRELGLEPATPSEARQIIGLQPVPITRTVN